MKIIWREKLSPYEDECHYLTRWCLITRFGSIRLHHWLKGDDNRYLHDHPWWYISILFSGAYIEWSDNLSFREALSIKYYPATHKHSISTLGCWTLLITGPEKRKWGFWVNNKFISKREYFKTIGHHQCD